CSLIHGNVSYREFSRGEMREFSRGCRSQQTDGGNESHNGRSRPKAAPTKLAWNVRMAVTVAGNPSRRPSYVPCWLFALVLYHGPITPSRRKEFFSCRVPLFTWTGPSRPN